MHNHHPQRRFEPFVRYATTPRYLLGIWLFTGGSSGDLDFCHGLLDYAPWLQFRSLSTNHSIPNTSSADAAAPHSTKAGW